jgi:hypothetical protein
MSFGFCAKILKNMGRLATALIQGLGQCRFLLQTIVSGKPMEKVNIIILAPDHEIFTTKTTVTSNDYSGIRPGCTNAPDNTIHLCNRVGGGIVTGWPQPGTQQMSPP